MAEKMVLMLTFMPLANQDVEDIQQLLTEKRINTCVIFITHVVSLSGMKKKVYLFDMNGVIIDDEHLHQQATLGVLQRHGYAADASVYKRHFAGRTRDSGFRNYHQALQAAYDIHALSEEKDELYQELARNGLRTVDHVVAFVRSLGKRGHAMAIVTGAPRKEAKHVLETFGLADHFLQVITGEDITLSKPHPEGYLKAAAMLQVSPAECVVVEDAPMGVQAAHRAGMRCAAVTTTHTPDELKEADWIVPRLTPKHLVEFQGLS
jgi:HAD superfamily hydrolase (TIGR01509 family)